MDCGCKEHREGAVFYVSMRDGRTYYLVSGPHETHKQALDMVQSVRRWANDKYPEASFASWGTTATTSTTKPAAYERLAEKDDAHK